MQKWIYVIILLTGYSIRSYTQKTINLNIPVEQNWMFDNEHPVRFMLELTSAQSGFSDRIRMDIATDFGMLSDELGATSCYDVIVSNPPYITEAEKQDMEANVLDWEPGLALFVPDDDPLRFYRRIVRLGCDLLLPGGKLYFEINQAYGRETAHILEMNQYRDVRVIKDIFGKDRIVTANR